MAVMNRAIPRLIFTTAVLTAAACGTESVKPVPLTSQADLYWTLELDHHAILLSTVAPWDTLTLVAMPRNPAGEVLDLPQPTFISSDIEKVVVSPNGVLQAIAPLPPGTTIQVIATLTYGNLRHADTAVVSVTDAAPTSSLETLSIHPLPPDSAKVAASPSFYGVSNVDTLDVRAIMADGTSLAARPGDPSGILPVHVRSSDTTTVRTDSRTGVLEVFGHQPGTATLYASTTAFGVTRADSLPYRIGWPVITFVDVGPPASGPRGNGSMPSANNVFKSPEVRVGVGGIVIWLAEAFGAGGTDSSLTIDVVFDATDATGIQAFTPDVPYTHPFLYLLYCSGFVKPSDCTNSTSFVIGPNLNFAGARMFTVPGVYEYESPLNPGSTGRVIVVDER